MAGKTCLAEVGPGDRVGRAVVEAHRLCGRAHGNRAVHQTDGVQACAVKVAVPSDASTELLGIEPDDAITHAGIVICIYNVGVMNET